jgi:hypothetical protein
MEIVKFVYEEQEVDFLPEGNENVMVNATQMAKIFGKRIDFFLKADHAKEFIKALEFTPFGGNSEPLKKEQIILTRGQSGTWMHRILALKFAAWLNPVFEVWIFSTLDQIILGELKKIRDATIEKQKLEKEKADMETQLLEKYPDEFARYLELEGKLTSAQKKRVAAIKATSSQYKMEIE